MLVLQDLGKYNLPTAKSINLPKATKFTEGQRPDLEQGPFFVCGVSPMVQQVKNPLAMQETPVRSQGWEGPGGGNGNLLQYSCLKNSHGHTFCL